MHAGEDPDAVAASAKDELITNIFYYFFFGLLFLIAFIILINCIISLCQHKMAERHEELLRQQRLQLSRSSRKNEAKKTCSPQNYKPGMKFQPRAPPGGLPPRIPLRRDYISSVWIIRQNLDS